MEIEKKIRDNEFYYFDEITTLFVKGIFDINSSVYTTKGIPFIRISNLKNLKIDDSDIVYLTEEENQKNKKTELKYGDVILSKTAYPACSLVTLEKCNVSQDTIAIKLKKDVTISSKFLVVFLNTNYGISQMRRYFTGNVQMHLNLTESKQIIIPMFSIYFQNIISDLFEKSTQKQTQSKQLYKEAEELLFKELDLSGYKPKHTLTFQTTKKEIDKAKRIDADYFHPKYKEIIERIEKYENLELRNKSFFKIITGTYTKTYSLDGKNYIRSVNINKDLTLDSERLYKTTETLESKFKVKEGDIITSRVGSIGTLGYISKEFEDSFISDNILRIRNLHNRLNNLFLAFYLKKIGTIFMDRLSRGSVQQRLNQETLKEIKIPLIESQIQKQIADKIKESHKLRKESKELLEEAKRKVEEEIEKGAKKMTKFDVE
ncbi:MAG: restriction endonuclease subunit S [Candidatus Aenigmarchaeota archaeon]|nr:restriction endonuclease subunit S [Candidatus Aenigmarchaeota archaeon]